VKAACGTLPNDDEEEEMEMEDMFVQTAMGSEWGGPMRGKSVLIFSVFTC